MRSKRCFAWGVTWALLCGVGAGGFEAIAQEAAKRTPYKLAPYAVIFGTVWDPDSRPVFGVHVQLRRAGERKVRWEAYSDHHGEFAFRVPPGATDYELSADPKSLKSIKKKSLSNPEPVKIHVEYDEQVDTGLHLIR